MPTMKDLLNQASPQNIADALRALEFGDMVRALPTFLRKKAAAAGAASNYNLATVAVYALPANCKAAKIDRCVVRAGGATGEFTPQAYGTTPATTQCAVTPCGDIGFLLADLPTDFDVLFTPEKGEVVELTLDVAANVATIPSAYTAKGVVLLTEAEVTAGTSTGKKAVLVPGAAAPAAGQARLNIAKSTITFAVADAATKCRVKILYAAAVDMVAALDASQTY